MKLSEIKKHVTEGKESLENISAEAIKPELLDLVSGGSSAGTNALPVDDRFVNVGWPKAW